MKGRLILITKKFQLFMNLNTYCNDHNWMIYNFTDPEDLLDFIKKRNIIGIIWDLDVSSLQKNLSLIKKIRQKFTNPILTLASKKNFEYEIKLFSLHIDDYIIEPYRYEEIIVKMQQCIWSRTIQTNTKTPELIDQNVNEDDNFVEDHADYEKNTYSLQNSHHNQFKFDNLLLDTNKYRVLKNNKDLNLTPKEFKLFYFLVKNKNQVISREQLLRNVWNYTDELGTSRIVDIHISHLRDKIEPDPHHPKYIKTIREFGYYFEEKDLKIIHKENVQ